MKRDGELVFSNEPLGIGLPSEARGWENQSSYAKASEDIHRALRERRMVEPDGIEPTT